MIRRRRAVPVFNNKYVEVYDDDVTFADGSEGRYVRIGHAAPRGQAAVILPVHDGSVGMVRTYRYPISEWQWALPRGFGHGADVLGSAKAELREELGVEAASWKLLGEVTPDSGLLSSKVAVFYAEVMSSTLTPADLREVAEAKWVPLGDVTDMIAAGELQDGFSLSALTLGGAAGVVDLKSG